MIASRLIDFNPRSPCGERLRTECVAGIHPDFNPRSPCGERLPVAGSRPTTERFQSTLPMRGATYYEVFYNRSTDISIHAPHAGSDDVPGPGQHMAPDFNPRSPCGERRRGFRQGASRGDFNPRSPCGERL